MRGDAADVFEKTCLGDITNPAGEDRTAFVQNTVIRRIPAKILQKN